MIFVYYDNLKQTHQISFKGLYEVGIYEMVNEGQCLSLPVVQ